METFKDIFSLFEYLKVPMTNGQIPHTAPRFEVMEMGPNEICAVPMPMFPLYRGQNTYYDVCKPSLYRSSWSQDALFERELQLADFRYILNEHPEIKDRIKAGLIINYDGLAQHYGIPTNILDFTNSPLVAAFFATTTYNAITDSYSPVLHTVSRGVIYVNQIGGMFEGMIPNHSCTMPVGMDALHRPGEQRAYGRKMNPDDDLNTAVGYNKYFFWHTPEASQKVWVLTGGGKRFFPYDPMTEKVRNLMNYRIYSEDALRVAFARMPQYAIDIAEARNKVIANGGHVVDYHPFVYTQQEQDFIMKELHQLYPDSY